MFIFRRHVGNSSDKFTIEDSKGNKIKDTQLLEYVKSLVIPPAYRDVKIYLRGSGKQAKTPKILFEGYDSKGRLQQIYSAEWRKKADELKFRSLYKFGKSLSAIYRDIASNIKKKRLSRDKIISLIIKIITLCYFRIGNARYQKLYSSFGIINIQKSHLKFNSNSRSLEIKFIGKKGVVNECMITDSELIDELLAIAQTRKPSENLFTFPGGEPVKARDVNNWLKKYGTDFSSKMFRTFDTNILFLRGINDIHAADKTIPESLSVSRRKKNIRELMKKVSECVNNTPAICQKSYMLPDLMQIYIEQPRKFKRLFMKEGRQSRDNDSGGIGSKCDTRAEKNIRSDFISFLKKKYKIN
jgi:DNA topoisomerase-1